jgi:hypothetical protein
MRGEGSACWWIVTFSNSHIVIEGPSEYRILPQELIMEARLFPCSEILRCTESCFEPVADHDLPRHAKVHYFFKYCSS